MKSKARPRTGPPYFLRLVLRKIHRMGALGREPNSPLRKLCRFCCCCFVFLSMVLHLVFFNFSFEVFSAHGVKLIPALSICNASHPNQHPHHHPPPPSPTPPHAHNYSSPFSVQWLESDTFLFQHGVRKMALKRPASYCRAYMTQAESSRWPLQSSRKCTFRSAR